MIQYKLNVKNHHTNERLYHALGFVDGYFDLSNHDYQKELAVVFMEKYFGARDKALFKYLRAMLLICTDPSYQYESNSKSMTYKVNHDGFKYLRYRHSNPNDTIGYRAWLNKIDASIKMEEDEAYESTYFDEDISSIKILTLEDAYFNLKSYREPMCDGKYLLKSIEKKFGTQLLSGEFVYNESSFRQWNGIQNIRRNKRQQILLNYGYAHSYDIEACAPTLILQLAVRHGLNPDKVPHYTNYLLNKKEVRESVASDAFVDIDVAKEIINATFNSARLGCNDIFALYHVLNCEQWRVIAVRENPYFSALKNDIKLVWEFIKKNVIGRTDIINIDWVSVDNAPRKPTDRFSSPKKWNLYFQLEYIVMNSIRLYMRDNSLQFFNEHDGWTSRNQIDIDELKHHIYDTTGFIVNIDYNLVKMDNEIITIIDSDNTGNRERSNYVLPCSSNHSDAVASSDSSDHTLSFFGSFPSFLTNNSDNNIIYKSSSILLNTLDVALPNNSVTSCVTSSTKTLTELSEHDRLEHKRMLARERKRKQRLREKM